MKKAQGISLNVIVIAIIALLVLVVLVAVFTGRLAVWGVNVTNCQKNPNAQCMLGDSCGDGYVQDRSSKCLTTENKPDPSLVCCIPVDTTDSEYY